MKIFGVDNPEGSSIKNLTAPSGTSFPSGTENVGELFFRTDLNRLYVYDDSEWIDVTIAKGGNIAGAINITGDVSASGEVSGSTVDISVSSLADLNDVSLGSPITDGYVLTYDTVNGWQPEAPSGGGSPSGSDTFATELLHIRDEKTSGTHGGTSSSNTWHTRDLNTVLINEITGASLSSNQITLPAGTYYIDATAPAFRSDQHRIALYNTTDTSYDMYGTSDHTINTQNVTTRSSLQGRFTITGSKTFEIQHRISFGKSTNGLGVSAGISGVIEVYTDVKIWKVA